MVTFSDWLKSELLRLKSFDWQPGPPGGARNSRSQPDGTMKFGSHYSLDKLAKEYGISADEIVKAVEQELTEKQKQFTVERKENTLTLSWVEDGIKDWATDISQHYSKENSQVPGKIQWKNEYYKTFRWVERIVYLDGKERVLKDSGTTEGPGAKVSREEFEKVLEQIKQMNAKQEADAQQVNQDGEENGTGPTKTE
jgi:hypothetical protein